MRADHYRTATDEREYRSVANAAEARLAIADGFRHEAPEPELAADVSPKEMIHPGFPNGGATGMVMKDYRGQKARKEIWKFDAALVAKSSIP